MASLEELETKFHGLPRNTVQFLAELHSGRDTEHGQYADGPGLV